MQCWSVFFLFVVCSVSGEMRLGLLELNGKFLKILIDSLEENPTVANVLTKSFSNEQLFYYHQRTFIYTHSIIGASLSKPHTD